MGIGVTDASYNQTDNAVSGIMIMIGSKKSKSVSPIYWKSGVIRKVCLSPKAAETRSMVKIEEKLLRQSIASLKQNLEEGEIQQYSWISGDEIVADVFTKQGSERSVLEEILSQNEFRHSLSMDNIVTYEDGEIKIANIVTKAQGSKQQ